MERSRTRRATGIEKAGVGRRGYTQVRDAVVMGHYHQGVEPSQ
jgi:hypothetical protein